MMQPVLNRKHLLSLTLEFFLLSCLEGTGVLCRALHSTSEMLRQFVLLLGLANCVLAGKCKWQKFDFPAFQPQKHKNNWSFAISRWIWSCWRLTSYGWERWLWFRWRKILFYHFWYFVTWSHLTVFLTHKAKDYHLSFVSWSNWTLGHRSLGSGKRAPLSIWSS